MFTGQSGGVVWIYGLSVAGKTTIATLLKAEFLDEGYMAIILDGDDLRSGVNGDLNFTRADRMENIRRASEIAKLLARNNMLVICAFITPLKENRTLARNIIKKTFFRNIIRLPFGDL